MSALTAVSRQRKLVASLTVAGLVRKVSATIASLRNGTTASILATHSQVRTPRLLEKDEYQANG
jgi:hypothetical protein